MKLLENKEQILKHFETLDKLVIVLIETSIQILNDHDFTMLDKGIGSNTKRGKKWLNFRKALTDVTQFIQDE